METPSCPSAATKETMHWTKRPAWIALQFRQPANKVFGDLRRAVAKGAVAVGCYSILVGCTYLARILGRETYGGEYYVDAICMICCIVAIVDAFLCHACKQQKNEAYLERLLCVTLILYKIDVPLSVVAYFVAMVISIDVLPLWILLRIIMCTFHMCLMYCLLVEIRESKGTPSPPDEEQGVPSPSAPMKEETEQQLPSPSAPMKEEAEQEVPSPRVPAKEEIEQEVLSPSAPAEETEQGVTSPSAPLEPTADHHCAKACENIAKKEDAGSGLLAPP